MTHVLPTRHFMTIALPLLACILTQADAQQTATSIQRPTITPQGVARPYHVAILNAPLDGILQDVLVKEGQAVKAGQQLVQMDDKVQQVVVRIAELKASSRHAIERAAKELDEAETMHERMVEAQATGAARDWEVRRSELRRDIARIAHEAAVSAHEIAQQELALETQRLQRFQLIAPWDGTVIRVTTDPGSTVSSQDPLIQMVGLEQLEVEIYLPLDVYNQVEVGQTYQLQALEPVNQTITGQLTFADRIIDYGSKKFRCVFTIDNADQSLPAGFAVQWIPSPASP